MLNRIFISSNSCRHGLLFLVAVVFHISLCVSLTLVDHLLPPPLAAPQALTHAKEPAFVRSAAAAGVSPLQVNVNTEQHDQSGFMTRVARWFGFGNNNLNAETYTNTQPNLYSNSKEPNTKDHCNLCNKYPWVPMLPFELQYPAGQHNQQHAPNKAGYGIETQESQKVPQKQLPLPSYRTFGLINQQQLPVKQRAVQFHFPNHNIFYYKKPHDNSKLPFQTIQKRLKPYSPQSPVAPIFVPNHSAPVTPPSIYVSKNVPYLLTTEQQLPSAEPAHFSENIGAHSELQPDSVFPTQIPPTTEKTKDLNFEIIKSHEITDFVSSVDYPATFVQSQVTDVGHTQIPVNNEVEPINVVEYVQGSYDSSVNSHTPASKILTTIANFSDSLKQNDANYDVSNGDNFPSASSHNLTKIEENNNIDFWNDIYYTTTKPPFISEWSTQQTETDFTEFTERSQQSTVEFVPSLETINIYQQQINGNQHVSDHSYDQGVSINHIQGINGLPRPFTRDPYELNDRLKPVHVTPQLLPYYHSSNDIESHAITSTISPQQRVVESHTTLADVLQPSPTRNIHQVLIPYTTKNRPRPFENARDADSSSSSSNKSSQLNNGELHEQHESKINSVTEAPPNSRRTTKYLTKILASNLRELLQREQKAKKEAHTTQFDISKLQNNIDDWTEQEYTSLSHRPSTPTIRGRSKHIPFEYFTTTTTTPSPRRAKTKRVFATELPTSINNLESSLLEASSKWREYIPVDDNYLSDSNKKSALEETKSSTTSIIPELKVIEVSYKTTTTQHPPHYGRALASQGFSDVWQKAKVSVSPQTKEKVYVVTPQPLFLGRRVSEIKPETSLANENVFKSPRFLVRPTPGNNSSSSSKDFSTFLSSVYSPNLFGLMRLSTYVPAQPVEIIDGKSKVITVVTPTADTEINHEGKFAEITPTRKIPQKKTTMSPSPR